MKLAAAVLVALVGLAPTTHVRAAQSDPPPDPLVELASLAPLGRAAADQRRCTGDGAHCIGLAAYVGDVCRTIEATAVEAEIDPHFFARLLWRESLFDASAVSPAGAEGIAQFMPGTAKLRGLADAFNPAEALRASALYLADLTRDYGNIGLAAVAYNGGEARAARFVAEGGRLPLETRAYVHAITGVSAETWREKPPEALDLKLPGADFQSACLAQAANRSLKEFAAGAPVLPWGVVVASGRDRTVAERQAERVLNRHDAILGSAEMSYTRSRRAGMPRAMHFAQVGQQSRGEAEALCGRLRAAGADCMVLKN